MIDRTALALGAGSSTQFGAAEGEAPSLLFRILELVISPSGAAIVIALLVFSAFLMMVVLPSARQGSWRFDLRRGSLERTSGNSMPKQEDDSEDGAPGSRQTIEPTDRVKDSKEEASEENLENEQESEKKSPFVEMIQARRKDDERGVEDAYHRWMQSENVNEENASRWRARFLIELGVPGALQELIKLEKENETWALPSLELARHYLNIKEFDLALEHQKIGIDRTEDIARISNFVSIRSEILEAQNRPLEALSLVRDFVSSIDDEMKGIKAGGYKKLADIYERLEDTERMTAALELSLSLLPDDPNCRFRLAYAYGRKEETKLLACYHYQILTIQDPKRSIAFNNYGAALGELGARAGEISAWKQGVGGDTDYPAGNLAIGLADAGFLTEAKKYLNDLPADLKAGERARYAADYLEQKERDHRETMENIEKSSDKIHRVVVQAMELESDQRIRDLENDMLSGKWSLTSDKKTEMELKGEKSDFSGEWREPSSIYKIEGHRVGPEINLHMKEIKRIQTPLEAIFSGRSEQQEDVWVEIYSNAKEFHLRLVVRSDQSINGVRIQGAGVENVAFRRSPQ